MNKQLKEDYIFDFPETEENKELFASKIDWEEEEKRLNNEIQLNEKEE